MTNERKEKYSKILIWVGVLAWVPYIALRVLGQDVSVWPFLIAHLIGVIGGIVLRPRDSKDLESESNRTKIIKRVSTILLAAGVSVWGVYFALEWITGIEREITPFLVTHLSGVLPGAGIKIYNFISRQ